MTYAMPVNRPLVLAKALVTAVLAAAVLVGTPWVLIRLVGSPLPTVVPSWDDVRFAVTNGQVDQWTWIKATAVIAWLAWGFLIAGFAVEIPAAVRGGRARAVAGLGASQWLAGRLIAGWSLAGSVLLQTLAAGPAGALPTLPPPAVATSTVVMYDSYEAISFNADDGPGFGIGADAASATARAQTQGDQIEVQRRDTLWSLAQDHLGSGDRWPELRDANVGRVMPDGSTLPANFTRVQAGWTLVVPGSEGFQSVGVVEVGEPGGSDATAAIEGVLPVQPLTPEPTTVPADTAIGAGDVGPGSAWSSGAGAGEVGTVAGFDVVGTWNTAEGEHFWAIAADTLATVNGRTPTEAEIRDYWLELMAANETSLVEPGNPDLLLPGQVLDVVRPGAVDDAQLAGLTLIPNFTATGGWSAAPVAPQPAPPPPPADTLPVPPVPADIGRATDAGSTDGGSTETGGEADAAPGSEAAGAAGQATPALSAEEIGELLAQIEAAPPPAPTAPPDTAPADAEAPGDADSGEGEGTSGDPTGSIPDVAGVPEAGANGGSTVGDTEPAPDPVATDPIASGSEAPTTANDVVVAGVLVLGVAAGSLMLVLRALRAFRSARRRPGAVAEPLEPALAELDKQIRQVADSEAAAWLAATNRLLTSRIRTDPLGRTPSILAMRAGAYGVELLLDEPSSPIDGFLDASELPADPADRTETGRVWRLDPDLDLRRIEQETASVQPYCPGMVPFGATEAGDLLVDVELEGAVMVTGRPDHAVGWLQSIALAAALVPWGEHLDVVAIGLDPGLARLPHVQVPADPLTWARERSLAARAQSEQLGGASTYQLRVEGQDLHYPTLVLIGPGHDDVARSLADAAALAAAPIALIAAAPLASGSRVFLEPDRGSLEPLGLEFEPAYTDSEMIRLACDLLDDAATPAPEPTVEEGPDPDGAGTSPVPTVCGSDGDVPDPDLFATIESPASGDGDDTAGAAGPVTVTEATPSAPHPVLTRSEVDEVVATIGRVLTPREIEVKLLAAQPSVEGLDRIQPKIEAVVVFLAHQRVVPVERLREQFWTASTNRSTADNAMTNVRRMLGQDPEGNPRLSFDRNTSRYVLSDDVGCDWTRVQELIALADTVGDPRAERAYLAAALGLVEGQPGADAPMKHYAWLRDNHEVYIPIEVSLTDAAFRLGELALDDGDPKLARWSANQGLLVVPGQEALHRVQMMAASLAGDPNGVDAAYRAAVRSAEVLSAWEDVQPETEELYAKLTRRRPVQRAEAGRVAS